MKYAKLTGGVIEYAHTAVVYKGKRVVNPSEEVLLELGYLPVDSSAAPPQNPPKGKHYEHFWVTENGKLCRRWQLADNPVSAPDRSDLTAELMTMQINSFALTDSQALRFAPLYPEFKSLIGQKGAEGFRFTYEDTLYAVIQPELTFEEHFPPGNGTESLYKKVEATHSGAKDDPIPAEANMEYFKDLYYTENGALYKCIRSSEIPLQHLPSQLVGIYFADASAK